MLPMCKSEALWINIKPHYIPDHETSYPFAIKVATGKINAITGKPWKNELNITPQDYMISTVQPWLNGYCTEKGIIRQFVAMSPGSGYSVEEQLTGNATHGGLQLVIYPMKRNAFDYRFPKIVKNLNNRLPKINKNMVCETMSQYNTSCDFAPGGKMHQEVYEDPFCFSDWDHSIKSRCFVHITNSLAWQGITGEDPEKTPFSAKDYNRQGLPWFNYCDEGSNALSGSSLLNKLKSVAQKENDRGNPIPDNDAVVPQNIKQLGGNQVREGNF